MVILTKDDVQRLFRICVLYNRFSILKLVYVAGMIGFCSYTNKIGIYDQYVYRVVSLILTANVIWCFFDICYTPIKEIMKIVRKRN